MTISVSSRRFLSRCIPISPQRAAQHKDLLSTSFKRTIMAERSKTLKEFSEPSLRTARATRPYMLDKPCVRCNRSTNIRVNLPTCSHRICSSCLADFESLAQNEGTVKCPACSTFWFSQQSNAPGNNGVALNNTELILGNGALSRAFARKSCTENLVSELDTATHVGNKYNREGCTSSNGIRDAVAEHGSSIPVENPQEEDNPTMQELALLNLRVQEHWKVFCSANVDPAPTAQSESLPNDQRKQISDIEPGDICILAPPVTMEQSVFELEATEKRLNMSDPQEKLPILRAEAVSDAPRTHEPSYTPVAVKKANQKAILLTIWLVLVWCGFELVSYLTLALACMTD